MVVLTCSPVSIKYQFVNIILYNILNLTHQIAFALIRASEKHILFQEIIVMLKKQQGRTQEKRVEAYIRSVRENNLQLIIREICTYNYIGH